MKYVYDASEFLSQATADFDVGNRPSGFPEFGNRALTIRNLAKFYARSARDEHFRFARSKGHKCARSTVSGVYFLDILD